MDKADAIAYRERWREVERIERLEAQSATIQDRWRQLNAAKKRATRLGITRKEDDGEMDIFLLWADLRKKYAAA
jgi:hypothetical protein